MLIEWAELNGDTVKETYDGLEELPIANDRMAELLLPLQAVLTVVDKSALVELEAYANDLEAMEEEAQQQNPGLLMLNACREIFTNSKANGEFMPTAMLINCLVARDEEPWSTWNKHGFKPEDKHISTTALASLLRPYGIKSAQQQKKTEGKNLSKRGYYATAFADAWARYLPPM